jgi:hypothetical protein
MNAKRRNAGVMQKLLVTVAAFLAMTFTTFAQVQTSRQVAAGAPTRDVSIERGTVVNVSGNSLIVKAEDGTLRHFDNVPESATVTVDGKQLNVHQLRAGMKLERQTVTTTVPKTITTIKSVTGRVTYVNPPHWVTLSLEDGTSQQFEVPAGQKFMVDGQETDVFGLKKGMRVGAQQVTESSELEVSRAVTRTGTMPPPPPPPAPDVAILIVHVVPVKAAAPPPAPVAAAAEPAPTALPKTASNLPLLGLLGVLAVGLGLALKVVRTTLERS